MAAVELTDREQIQHGEKHPDPAADDDRMGVEPGVAVGYLLAEHSGDQIEQRRVVEHDGLSGLSFEHSRRHLDRAERQADGGDDDGGDETGDGAGRADIEEGLPARHPAFHPDDRAQRAERENERNDVRQRDGDAVVATHRVVAEFVDQQDAQHRRGKGPRLQDRQRVGRDLRQRHVVPAVGADEQRREEGRRQQPDIQPRHAVAIALARGRRHECGPVVLVRSRQFEVVAGVLKRRPQLLVESFLGDQRLAVVDDPVAVDPHVAELIPRLKLVGSGDGRVGFTHRLPLTTLRDCAA